MSKAEAAAAALLDLRAGVNPLPGNDNLVLVNMRNGAHQVGPIDAAGAMTEFTFPRQPNRKSNASVKSKKAASAASAASAMQVVEMPPSAAMQVMPSSQAFVRPIFKLQIAHRNPAPTQRSLKAINPDQLREICRKHGIDPIGTKQQVSDRICLKLGEEGANIIDRMGRENMSKKGGKSQKRKARSHHRKSHRKSHHRKSHKHGRRAH